MKLQKLTVPIELSIYHGHSKELNPIEQSELIATNLAYYAQGLFWMLSNYSDQMAFENRADDYEPVYREKMLWAFHNTSELGLALIQAIHQEIDRIGINLHNENGGKYVS